MRTRRKPWTDFSTHEIDEALQRRAEAALDRYEAEQARLEAEHEARAKNGSERPEVGSS